MERARYNTELCSNPGPLLNNVKPSNFWGSHHWGARGFCIVLAVNALLGSEMEIRGTDRRRGM